MTEINLREATLDWLEMFIAKFQIGGSMIQRTEKEALRWFLSEKLGISTDDFTVQDSSIQFSTSEIDPDQVRTLVDTVLVNGPLRFAFAGLTATTHCEPYSEPYPYIQIEYRAR